MPPKLPLWSEKFPNYHKVVIADDLKAKIDKEKRQRWLLEVETNVMSSGLRVRG